MRSTLSHPVRLIPLAFLSAITIGTLLLMTPWARADSSEPIPLVTAAFTAVSATCVTGLTVVDTPTYWSTFGKVVILLLIQIGGFGLMTLATLMAMLVTGRIRLRSSLVVQTESHAVNVGIVKGVMTTILVTTLSLEALMAGVLAARLHATYEYGAAAALWHGLFHSVSAFNNAGFALYSDSLMSYAGDVTILIPVMALIIAGGIGYPVFHELTRHWRRPGGWSIHTRLTVLGTLGLITVGALGTALFEWGNANTIGPMTVGQKLLNSLFGSITARTAGFNTFDYALATHESWALYDVLMFIGGGSAGTAGGLKVSTFIVLAYVIWSEVRGEEDVVMGRRSLPAHALRQAVTVALLAVGMVAIGTLVLLLLTDYSLDLVLFQTISAFATVGLSNGITDRLPETGQWTLIALMFLGRIGTVTAASALALRHRHRAYHLPQEQPIIG